MIYIYSLRLAFHVLQRKDKSQWKKIKKRLKSCRGGDQLQIDEQPATVAWRTDEKAGSGKI
jgi:hypothetical protein